MVASKYKTKGNKIKWRCRFYYNDSNGSSIEKKKQGFTTKKEADDWEMEFLTSIKFSPTMPFKDLANMYMEDAKHRIKLNTLNTRKAYLEGNLLPYFGNTPVNEIEPITIRNWQNKMLSTVNHRTNKKYSPTYLKSLNTFLSTIFNFAVKYHGLSINPCSVAGSMGTLRAEEMHIWTLNEFKTFINGIDREDLHLGFNLLYWTGMRVGELLALTWNDFIIEDNLVDINKSYQRINGKDIITPPKTKKSIRKIVIPDELIKEVQDYKTKIYKPNDTDRLFYNTKRVFEDGIKKYSKKVGLEPIRVHDLRHSHASLLIYNDINVVVVSKRLGHEKVSTTLNIYSHMFPENQDHISSLINGIFTSKKEPI